MAERIHPEYEFSRLQPLAGRRVVRILRCCGLQVSLCDGISAQVEGCRSCAGKRCLIVPVRLQANVIGGKSVLIVLRAKKKVAETTLLRRIVAHVF